MSHGEVAERVTRLIEHYTRAGYGHGHRVSLVLENRPEFMLHFLALNALGCWVVPLTLEDPVHQSTWATCSAILKLI